MDVDDGKIFFLLHVRLLSVTSWLQPPPVKDVTGYPKFLNINGGGGGGYIAQCIPIFSWPVGTIHNGRGLTPIGSFSISGGRW